MNDYKFTRNGDPTEELNTDKVRWIVGNSVYRESKLYYTNIYIQFMLWVFYEGKPMKKISLTPRMEVNMYYYHYI